MHSQHFILIGNYPPDGQESMIRFADLLANGLKNRGLTVELLTPQPILVGKNAHPGKGILKWLAYVDKWILFPFTLRRVVRKRQQEFGNNIHYHICDHSNAPYLAYLPKNRAGITCHDVLAIRGALGYPETYCAASRTGVILQRWILKHLRNAQRIACVSHLTLRHLFEIAGENIPKPGWRVVHNSLNAEFKKIETSEAIQILERQNIFLPRPFLLHVGSDLPRKNRRMLLQMIKQENQPWPGHLCFAGEPVDPSLSEEARTLGILDRVHSAPKPDHKTLCALYSLAHAFVFPSFSEGFGWPLIEAQACGTPVIASHLEPLPEVSGGAALHADPHDAKSFASALLKLNDAAVRESLVEQGLANAARFGLAPMIDKYLALHNL
jgi:glycosyltransferase involved in cell wall biosynthesis